MADRPILFSGPMIRALLAGTKTQTRRVVKPQPDVDARFFDLDVAINMKGEPAGLAAWFLESNDGGLPPVFCPYGQPGDRLWVRETWRRDIDKADGARLVQYRADDAIVEAPRTYFDLPSPGWIPSIHMPRWASRITLEVAGVRVERLQDISEADAQAEGITPLPNHPGRWLSDHRPGLNFPSAVAAYRDLWEQINGPESWSENPHVWVVEFRLVTP